MHAVIFDIDGTLLESMSVDETLYKEAIVSILGSVRFRPSLVDYECVTDMGILLQVLEDNSLPLAEEKIAAIKARFVAALRSHITDNGPFPEVPGARSMLEQLQDSADHTVAMATGGWRESAQLKLASADLASFGFPLASSDDAIARRDIMRIALEQLGESFRSVTYYGDGPWDREACLELGWRFVPVGPALGGISSYEEAAVVC